jgi:anti-anti-sigma regulatory factor
MTEEEQGVIRLGRVEGIDTAEELWVRLQAATAAHGDLVLDAQAVISIDSTTLQMLVAVVRQTLAEGASIRWAGSSKKFIATANLLGLADELQLE